MSMSRMRRKTNMVTAMISGHLDLTIHEFGKYYTAKIDEAVAAGCSFVVGDATGADTFAQAYLAARFVNRDVPPVKVYHAYEKPRNNVGGFMTDGHYTSQNA